MWNSGLGQLIALIGGGVITIAVASAIATDSGGLRSKVLDAPLRYRQFAASLMPGSDPQLAFVVVSSVLVAAALVTFLFLTRPRKTHKRRGPGQD